MVAEGIVMRYLLAAILIMFLIYPKWANAGIMDRSHSDFYPSTLWQSGEVLSGGETVPYRNWRPRPPYFYGYQDFEWERYPYESYYAPYYYVPEYYGYEWY